VRLLATLILLTAVAAAQDSEPLLQAKGETLAEFAVVVSIDRVDHSSARALAESFARLHVDNHAMSERFAQLVRKGHEEVVRRYFTERLARRTRGDYLRAEKKRQPVRCLVESVEPGGDEATALLRREHRGKTHTMQLEMKRTAGQWRLVRVLHADPKKGFVDKGLGIPPPVWQAPGVPEKSRPDYSTPQTVVTSLRKDIHRFSAESNRARGQMHLHFFRIVEAFYGKDVAAAAKQRQPKPAGGLKRSYKLLEPDPPVEGTVRVQVLIEEEIPGGEGKRSAIGNFAYDLRRDVRENVWRIVGEFMRPKPDEPLVPRNVGFGMAFAG